MITFQYFLNKFHFPIEKLFFIRNPKVHCEIGKMKYLFIMINSGKIQIGKDQEKAQSEKDSRSKNRGGKKTKPIIRYLHHETYRKPNEQLFSQ